MEGFTKGPWRAEKYVGREDNWFVRGPADESICGRGSGCVNEANARLIAAAPELFEALLTKRDYVADAANGGLTYVGSGEGFMAMAKEDLSRIDAALAKAKGETT